MPTSPDGVLQAEFDPAWAAVRLVVDGGMWPAPVDALTITRQVAGQSDMPVRGVEDRPAIAGYFVGSDPEAPLQSPVTYRVDGYTLGVLVASASVTVQTDGAAPGMWIKVPGQPDLTMLVPFRALSAVDSPTIGGVYQIAGGGTVAQTTAQWSGIETDQATVELAPRAGVDVGRLRAALAAGRVVLLQPVGSTDLDAGWYYISRVSRENPAGMEAFAFRVFTLSVQRTGVPVGEGQGLAGASWAAVAEQYPTWFALMAAKAAWFDLMQGV